MTQRPPPSASPFEHAHQFYIEGQWTAPSGDASFDLVDSATQERYGQFAEAQEADALRAIDAARRAFDQGPWPRLSHAQRAQYIQAIGRELGRLLNEQATAWTRESGIVFAVAKAVCQQTPTVYERYAELANTFAFVEPHHMEQVLVPVGLPGYADD